MDNVLAKVVWDDSQKGLYVFLTDLRDGESSTHYFWDAREDAWYRDVFDDDNINPRSVHLMDGDDPDDRRLLLGGADGYIRCVNRDASDDDGTAIYSYALTEPLKAKGDGRVMLSAMNSILTPLSKDVTWELLTGTTAEEATNSTVFATGTWQAGRNGYFAGRVSGHSVILKVSNTESAGAWSVESVFVGITSISGPGQRIMV